MEERTDFHAGPSRKIVRYWNWKESCKWQDFSVTDEKTEAQKSQTTPSAVCCQSLRLLVLAPHRALTSLPGTSQLQSVPC